MVRRGPVGPGPFRLAAYHHDRSGFLTGVPIASASRRTASSAVSWCLGATGATAAMVALCWAEALIARSGPRLCMSPPTSDGLHGPGEAAPLRVVWLGDSLAVGVGVDQLDELPAVQLAHQLGHRCEVRVRAVPGATSADVVALQLRDAELSYADIVVVQVGANDVAGMTSRRRFRANYRRILAAAAGRTVVCVGIPDFSAAARLAEPLRTVAGARGRMLDAVVRSEARAADCVYVDISSRPADLDRAATRSLLSSDRYHPGPSGYAIWARQIAETLQAAALASAA